LKTLLSGGESISKAISRFYLEQKSFAIDTNTIKHFHLPIDTWAVGEAAF